MRYSSGEVAVIAFPEDKAVGAGSNAGNARLSGMVDHFQQIVEKKERFAARKRNGLEAFLSRRVDYPPDILHGNTGTRKGFAGAHAALGTSGITGVCDLNHQLPWNTALPPGALKGAKNREGIHALTAMATERGSTGAYIFHVFRKASSKERSAMYFRAASPICFLVSG